MDAASSSSSLETADESSPTSSAEPEDTAPDERDEVKEVERLASRETNRVRLWRVVVIAMILIVGALVSSATYLFLKRAEAHEFQESYNLFANAIQDATEFHVENLMRAFRGLGEVLTSYAIASNSTFPFVTPPMFEVHAWLARQRSGIEVFAFTPIVSKDNRSRWEKYAVANQGWLAESRQLHVGREGEVMNRSEYLGGNIIPWINERDENNVPHRSLGPGPYAPVWLMSAPPFSPLAVNFDLLSIPGNRELSRVAEKVKEAVLSPVRDFFFSSGKSISPEDHDRWHAQYVTSALNISSFQHPHSLMLQPVFSTLDDLDSADIVGYLAPTIPWDRYVADLLPEGVNGIFCVISNGEQKFTYVLIGRRALYLGPGDQHDAAFDSMEVVVPFSQYMHRKTSRVEGHCQYSFHIYPSETLRQYYESNIPEIFTVIAAMTFVLMALTFFMYDRFVQRRNAKVVGAAAASNGIVSSLFPSNVRDRLFDDAEDKGKNADCAHKSRLSKFLSTGGPTDGEVRQASPIADLFLEATVLFADIVGFTAWSSVREPAQVFLLLETVFTNLDDIASKRRVFKVETVGDCYVAVTGVPNPRKDHAVAMARFARDCMRRMHSLAKQLEVSLGPETAELMMRMGIHSGPVTAGVLRGKRARFQLFGDTMNTASRLESTGKSGAIQISQDTASLLVAAGKEKWMRAREEKIVAKGKGEMETFWLLLGRDISDSVSSTTQSHSEVSSSGGCSDDPSQNDAFIDPKTLTLTSTKTARLIEWNTDILLRILKQIVARRKASKYTGHEQQEVLPQMKVLPPDHSVIDEVEEIITLPKFDSRVARAQKDADSIVLGKKVVEQMRDYVTSIAAMYRNNAFHDFEHASHVIMSVVKLLSRIVAPSDIPYDEVESKKHKATIASSLHDHTYGITSDPLTQFACIFSALIHDVDHTGVPNAQLVREKAKIADFYKGKSVAEQNSVDLAWNLLMDEKYAALRSAIYESESEKSRFRQLIVNSVMATDILDKDLIAARNARWERAFQKSSKDIHNTTGEQDEMKDTEKQDSSRGEEARNAINRKATIVIEHLIQASDVAHTMQHWHIYRKWNERFFLENYHNYQQGRTGQPAKHPAEFWYKGEIGFFDFYIIPLAKKLKECGVFGVSSDEYLNYAVKNRQEWEQRGQEVVAEIMNNIEQQSAESKKESCNQEGQEEK